MPQGLWLLDDLEAAEALFGTDNPLRHLNAPEHVVLRANVEPIPELPRLSQLTYAASGTGYLPVFQCVWGKD
jgi:hypothetical protein